ncbi:MAG: DegT/DnrJ/EryC1/StrS family aminotransferase [Thermodesulfobacteriota bacterium]
MDLTVQYGKIKEEVKNRIDDVFENQRFILGPNVEGLEEEVAGYCGTRYGIGVASGSDALLLSLMALGISWNDTVVTTPNTIFSTAGSIVRLGAHPIFVDIDPGTYNIDPNRLEDLLKELSTNQDPQFRFPKAIIPVHLFGQCADMGPILEIAERFEIKVIEDAAQAFGAEYCGKMVGSIGDTGCFSFFPSKNLGGVGDGGMVTTNDKTTSERLRMLRGHGSDMKYYHKMVGLNSRLDEVQAACLRVKLKYLDGWIERRRQNADIYQRLFQEKGLADLICLPHAEQGMGHTYNQFVVRVPERDALREYLMKKGIGTEVYYPIPLHLQKAFDFLGYKEGAFPHSEKSAEDVLALPIYPELTKVQQEYVVNSIRDFYGGRR